MCLKSKLYTRIYRELDVCWAEWCNWFRIRTGTLAGVPRLFAAGHGKSQKHGGSEILYIEDSWNTISEKQVSAIKWASQVYMVIRNCMPTDVSTLDDLSLTFKRVWLPDLDVRIIRSIYPCQNQSFENWGRGLGVPLLHSRSRSVCINWVLATRHTHQPSGVGARFWHI